jgi:hypothetical protein
MTAMPSVQKMTILKRKPKEKNKGSERKSDRAFD